LRRLAILLLALFLLSSLAPAVRADDYKPGPTFQLSNGHMLTTRFYRFSDEAVDAMTAVLNEYVPKLLQIFYEPDYDYDYLVQINGDPTCLGVDQEHPLGCVPGAAEGAVGFPGPDWQQPSSYRDPPKVATIIHEFTHVLQFAPRGPAYALGLNPKSDDAGLFYIESTAMVMPAILMEGAEGADLQGRIQRGYYWDFAFDEAAWGVAVAASAYRLLATKEETHVGPSLGWLALYRADNHIFREMNAKLSELSMQGHGSITIPELREVIRRSTSVQVLNGFPIKQWLAIEGFLARDEVSSYSNMIEPRPFSPTVVVNPAMGAGSTATFYNAVTRELIGEEAFQGGAYSGYVPYLTNITSRVIVRTSYVQSLLLPPHLSPSENPEFFTNNENAVLLGTPDGWLQPVNATAVVNGQTWPIVNGVLRFTSTSPLVTIDLPNRRIENFVTNGAVMVVGAFNYTALQLMHDTDELPHPVQMFTNQTNPPQISATPRCVIATAAYGSEMAPEVVYMRSVRDRMIGSTPTGRVLRDAFNNWYYTWSPSVAQYISDKPLLRAVFRVLLVPIDIAVRVADLAFHAAGGGDFGSILGFILAAIISILSYVVIPTALSVFAIRWAKRRIVL